MKNDKFQQKLVVFQLSLPLWTSEVAFASAVTA